MGFLSAFLSVLKKRTFENKKGIPLSKLLAKKWGDPLVIFFEVFFFFFFFFFSGCFLFYM
jgi:hypothetical protein